MRDECVKRSRVAFLLSVLSVTACVDTRDRPTVPEFGQLSVRSDPEGATIFVDGNSLGSTPDTVGGIAAGNHRLFLSLEGEPMEIFAFGDSVRIPANGLATVDAALEGGCGRNCPHVVDQGRVLCRFTNHGDTCAGAFFDSEPALQWPGASGDFSAGGRLVVAAIFGPGALSSEGDTTATQIFRQAWVGRRPVAQAFSGLRQETRFDYWATALFPAASLLGLSAKQTIIAVDSSDVEDVLFIRYEIENVSADERYRATRGFLPAGGFTFTELYVGFGLDADIGLAGDDLATFDLDNDLAFMYDADFSDDELGSRSDRPPLVGMVAIDPPPGAMRRTFTAWRAADDWDDGDKHDFAWRIFAGRLAGGDPISDHPSAEIGFHPNQPNDFRITIAHGPVDLAPGESTTMTVALILANPVQGTFTSGERVPTGDPLSSNRQILQVAENLRSLAAQVPEFWQRYSNP